MYNICKKNDAIMLQRNTTNKPNHHRVCLNAEKTDKNKLSTVKIWTEDSFLHLHFIHLFSLSKKTLRQPEALWKLQMSKIKQKVLLELNWCGTLSVCEGGSGKGVLVYPEPIFIDFHFHRM